MGQCEMCAQGRDLSYKTTGESIDVSKKAMKRQPNRGFITPSSSLDSSRFNDSDSGYPPPSEPLQVSEPSVDADKIQSDFLRVAIRPGNETLTMYLVEEHPEIDLLNVRDDERNTTLHIAVENQSDNLILYLLTHGLSPNTQNLYGETCLHLAVKTRNIKIVSLLMKHSADPQITSNNTETPISIASVNGDEDILHILSHEHDEDHLDLEEEAPALYGVDSMEDVARDISFVIASPDSTTAQRFTFAEANSKIRGIFGMNDAYKDEEEEKFKEEVTIISRKNPFTKLRRQNTKKLLLGLKEKCPGKMGWVEKKQLSKTFAPWQKRFVVVKGAFMLWSDKKRDIKDPSIAAQRMAFNNCINIKFIQEIKLMPKNDKCFVMKVKVSGITHKKKEYVFRCATNEDASHWVKSIKNHIEYWKKVEEIMGN